jgi:hypothetical protein
MVLFTADDYGADPRGWRTALREAHAELAATRRSLRSALDCEGLWRRRCELGRVRDRRRHGG